MSTDPVELHAEPLGTIRSRFRAFWLFWACTWTVAILILCWTPQNRLPVDENRSPLLKRIHADKIVHAGIFAVFGTLWMHALRSGRRRAWVLVSGVALAILTEVGQGLLPINRVADVYDGLADIGGALASVYLCVKCGIRS